MKKYFILLFVLVNFVQYIFCDNFLSKFHQNDYKLKDMRIQLMHFDKNYYNFFEVTEFKYNRSTTAHNSSWNFKEDVKDKLEILVQVHKFLSNEYRVFPIRFQANLQKVLKQILSESEQQQYVVILRTAFFGVTYTVCNFVIDETQFPPLIPSGKYRIDVEILYLNSEISAADIYAEVYRPIPYSKKHNP